MILLSFDTEEFDVPREHGVDFPLDEAMKVSVYGTNRILDCLKNNGVKATFFCTSNFAENAPEVMRRIMDEGHEVAAHGCDHWQPQASDVRKCITSMTMVVSFALSCISILFISIVIQNCGKNTVEGRSVRKS